MSTQVLRCNWVTSLLASVVLWGFIIWAMVGGDETTYEVGDWQSWVTINFTWLYIGTQDVWFIFVLGLLFTKYRHIKLGRDDEKPAFGDYEWFSMLFACGIGVGLYTFGVQEPMAYYRGGALNKIPFDNDDQRAQQAIFITLFHWGLHAWIPYVTVALTLGVVCYRQGRPMTIRSAFYPVLGENINGLVGDLIDSLSIACTTFGVCTSLGLGVTTIAATMNRINHNINPSSESVQSLIIWCITAAATTSVLSGLKVGIKNLSQITFSIGLVFLFSLILADSPFFLMNSFVQSVGHYLQWVTVVGWDCDTWPQWTGVVTEASGGWGSKTMHYLTWGRKSATAAIKAASAAYTAGEQGTSMFNADPATQAANIAKAWGNATGAKWIDWWTIFYWGWWISWAPFVGMFIARISRGRTVQQVIMGAFIAPVLFGFFFLTVLGTLGIKMQRVAELALGNDAGALDFASGTINCTAMGYEGGAPASTAAVALANEGYYALACRAGSSQILDVVEPSGDLKRFFQLLILVGVILYFITSSDSGSYVDDLISSQGYECPPPFQKIYWACTEGALAQALVTKGGLYAVRSVSIVAGLPYTLAINFMMVALWRALKEESGDLVDTRRGFNTCIFDFLEAFKPANAGANAPDQKARLVSVAKGLLFPYEGIRKSHLAVGDDERSSMFMGVVMTSLVYLWISLLAATNADAGAHTIAWLMLCIFCFKLAGLRRRLREARNVAGNVMEDYSCAMLMYPFCLAQMEHEADASDKTA